MKGAILLLLLAAGTFYYFYAKTDRLDPYLEKYAPALLEAKGGAVASSEEVATGLTPINSTVPTSFLELKSKDGRSIKANIISRGPVGVRAQRHDGQVFEIPFETLDADTVAVLNAIQTFPHPQ